MSNRVARCAIFLSALALLPFPSRGMAQSVLDRAKKRAEESAKQKLEDRLARKAEDGIDKVLDGAEKAITCVATDKACIQKAEKSGDALVLTDASGKEVSRRPAKDKATESGGVAADTGKSASASAPASRMRVGEGAWANYDFIPGEKPLLSDDFSKDVIGDFPRRLEASGGNVELVTWKGGRWLQMNGNNDNKFYVPAGAKLPSRWTLEFDFVSEGRRECWIYPSGVEGDDYVWFGARNDGGMQRKDGRSVGTRSDSDSLAGTPFTARIMVDGRYIKAYVNERRVVNIPNLDYTPSDKVLFYCDGKPDEVVLLNNIRLAAGGRKLYDALAESGRVATQGIFFDVGSDRIRPESSPTLKEIGEMLTEHGTLKLLIEGHTDNTGVAAGNLALSQKRAEAVRAYLTSTFGIDAARLSAKGLGQTVPAAPNTTAEGRQQNRRVELVKQP